MDQEWVLDSLVGFLRGPLWSEPVFTFLDERSVVFDIDDTPENQDEYRKVYEDYKKLVNQLLDCHMRELSISPKQFEQAVQDANEFLSQRLQQTLFEQIWAADHFESFKRMMIQVNIDLQLWALEILAAKYGIIPGLFLPEGLSVEDFMSHDLSGDYQGISSKLRSLVNFAAVEDERAPEEGQPEETPSAAAQQQLQQHEQQRHQKPQRQQQQQPQEQQGTVSLHATSVPTIPHDSSEPVKRVDEEMKKEKSLPPLRKREEGERRPSAVSNSTENTQFQEIMSGLLDVQIERPKTAVLHESKVKTIRNRLKEDKEELDAEEIRKRQSYLRSQRDRLLKLKKEEREQQVKRMQELQQSGQRPPTAKFIALEKEKQKEDEKESSGSERALAYMRTLAARIKSEVTEPVERAGDEEEEER